jgi:phytoene synthase
VGRLLLHLYDAATPVNLKLSGNICTSLQLINFWQDVEIDWRKQRIYLPLEDLERFGVSEAQIDGKQCDKAWHALMSFEIDRARTMMLAGAPLARHLPGRIGWELRLIVLGGLRILERIEAVKHDVFNHRPTLTKTDWPRLAWRALRYSPT